MMRHRRLSNYLQWGIMFLLLSGGESDYDTFTKPSPSPAVSSPSSAVPSPSPAVSSPSFAVSLSSSAVSTPSSAVSLSSSAGLSPSSAVSSPSTTPLAQPSRPIPGRLCCDEEQLLIDNACVPGAKPAKFSPVYHSKYTPDSHPVGVQWSTNPVECPGESKLTYYPLKTRDNFLIVKGESVELIWDEGIAYKRTKTFCVGVDPDENYTGVTCRPDLEVMCGNRTCLRKCCGLDEALSIFTRNAKCIKSSAHMTKFFPTYRSMEGENVPLPNDVNIVDLAPKCPNTGKIDTEDNYHLLPDGRLFYPSTDALYEFNDFCLDILIESSESPGREGVFYCSERPLNLIPTKLYIQAGCVLASVVFLLITIVMHFMVPDLRNFQGLCMISHMVSLMVFYLALFPIYILKVEHAAPDTHAKASCVVNGLAVQFGALSTFLWLNVLCIDIWRVIRATGQLVHLREILANDKKRFIFYSIYAWGGAILVSTITAIIHYLPEEAASSGLVRPGFGLVSCFFPGHKERLVYMYGIVLLLFVMDLALVIHTVFMLHKAGSAFTCFSQNNQVTVFNRNHLQNFWQRFCIFILTILCWTTELLSWKIPPMEMWIPTDILNACQGIIIFLIFVTSKHKRKAIKKALRKSTRRNRKMSDVSQISHLSETSKLTSSTAVAQETVPLETMRTLGAQVSDSSECNPW